MKETPKRIVSDMSEGPDLGLILVQPRLRLTAPTAAKLGAFNAREV